MKNELSEHWQFPFKASLLLLLVFEILLCVAAAVATYIFKPETPEMFFMEGFFEALMMAAVMIFVEIRHRVKRKFSIFANGIVRAVVPDTMMALLVVAVGVSLHVGYHVINGMVEYIRYDFFNNTAIFVSFFAAFVFLYFLVSFINVHWKRLHAIFKTLIATAIASALCFISIAIYEHVRCDFAGKTILYFFVPSFCFCLGIGRFVILDRYFHKTIREREIAGAGKSPSVSLGKIIRLLKWPAIFLLIAIPLASVYLYKNNPFGLMYCLESAHMYRTEVFIMDRYLDDKDLDVFPHNLINTHIADVSGEKLGDYDKAISLLKKRLAFSNRKESKSFSYFMIGYYYYRKGELKKSENNYLKWHDLSKIEKPVKEGAYLSSYRFLECEKRKLDR